MKRLFQIGHATGEVELVNDAQGVGWRPAAWARKGTFLADASSHERMSYHKAAYFARQWAGQLNDLIEAMIPQKRYLNGVTVRLDKGYVAIGKNVRLLSYPFVQFDPEDPLRAIQAIVEDYKAGVKREGICHRYKISHKTMQVIVGALGIKRRRRGGRQACFYDKTLMNVKELDAA